MVEKALKLLWTDKCTIYNKVEETNQFTKRTSFIEKVIVKDEPCKLSFNSLTGAELDNVTSINQTITLFISNKISIPSGSKIVITRNENTFTYTNSGQPRIFTKHQEIKLELCERWA